MRNLILIISLSLPLLSFDLPGNKPPLVFNEDAVTLYTEMELSDYGLSQDAFMFALKDYNKLTERGRINKPGILTICDFSQSSRKKRLYIIDLENKKLLINTYVAHGRNSGTTYATRFSNKASSHQSSLGFYKTRLTYHGEHGLSLALEGLEKGINDKAMRRHIVIHGSDYVGENYLKRSPYMGRSFGCPAVPRAEAKEIISLIKDGSCLFIYHPGPGYRKGSKLLND